jgi:hypothetical protein
MIHQLLLLLLRHLLQLYAGQLHQQTPAAAGQRMQRLLQHLSLAGDPAGPLTCCLQQQQ